MLRVAAGDTPLTHAVRHGHVDVVAVMLANGTYDVNEPMTNGVDATALYVACENGVADVFESCVIPHDIASEMW